LHDKGLARGEFCVLVLGHSHTKFEPAKLPSDAPMIIGEVSEVLPESPKRNSACDELRTS